MIRRPPRSTLSSSSAASDVYKRQGPQESVLQWHVMIATGKDSPTRMVSVTFPMDYPYSAPVLRLCNSKSVPSDIPYSTKQEWTPFSGVSGLLEEFRDAISIYSTHQAEAAAAEDAEHSEPLPLSIKSLADDYFKLMDMDNDGRITIDEGAHVMEKVYKVTSEKATMMWRKMQGEADKDADGGISHNEWIMFIQNVASLGRICTIEKQYQRACVALALKGDLERVAGETR
eukprot:TRINITY_DN45929_c0_g1_i1.p1 TRINITY_DN45929_c0_g1~~TRINITY_DN45929_c0_g1_i1.p1  ORF type:complete len:230 (+),score=49.41 TRINITY_DN45929_c0_g1_i1:29-718(+)